MYPVTIRYTTVQRWHQTRREYPPAQAESTRLKLLQNLSPKPTGCRRKGTHGLAYFCATPEWAKASPVTPEAHPSRRRRGQSRYSGRQSGCRGADKWRPGPGPRPLGWAVWRQIAFIAVYGIMCRAVGRRERPLSLRETCRTSAAAATTTPNSPTFVTTSGGDHV